MADVKDEPFWKDPDDERRLEEADDRIRAMSDEELKALVEPVWDRSPAEWSEDQLNAEVELDHRLGVRGETSAEMDRHPPRTVPISIRMPADLLNRVREVARQRHTPYQRLIRELVEAGLAANTKPLARLEVSAELLSRIADERAVIVEVRRAP
jgi:predicted DNA binding CopG/RHH family protein